MLSHFKKIKQNAGLTYIELIVVLGIFASITSVALFNYGDFQGKVDIKGLGSEIAQRIVEAQKNAVAGKIAPQNPPSSWRPAYGIYFNLTGVNGGSADNKNFISFVDINGNEQYDDVSCSLPPVPAGGECIDKTTITKGNTISRIDIFYTDGSSTVGGASFDDLSILFIRPDSGAIFDATEAFASDVAHVEITFASTSGISAKIRVFPSGRIELN